MTWKITKQFNKDENWWEYVFTDGLKYSHVYSIEKDPDKREDYLINWFNQCLRIIDDQETPPAEPT